MPIGIGLTSAQKAALKRVPPVAYSNYVSNTVLNLTVAPQFVAVMNSAVNAVGFTESGGLVTYINEGVYSAIVSRVYKNEDQNPRGVINATILVESDKNDGAGFVTRFTRTLPGQAAKNGNEPAIISFTSRFIFEVDAGEVFRYSFSAEDDGLDPQSLTLIGFSASSNIIANLP